VLLNREYKQKLSHRKGIEAAEVAENTFYARESGIRTIRVRERRLEYGMQNAGTAETSGGHRDKCLGRCRE
jgi:hypothetical protein